MGHPLRLFLPSPLSYWNIYIGRGTRTGGDPQEVLTVRAIPGRDRVACGAWSVGCDPCTVPCIPVLCLGHMRLCFRFRVLSVEVVIIDAYPLQVLLPPRPSGDTFGRFPQPLHSTPKGQTTAGPATARTRPSSAVSSLASGRRWGNWQACARKQLSCIRFIIQFSGCVLDSCIIAQLIRNHRP